MLVKEFYKTLNDGTELYRFFSDQNLYILSTLNNAEYIEAIDKEEKENLFIESTKLILNK